MKAGKRDEHGNSAIDRPRLMGEKLANNRQHPIRNMLPAASIDVLLHETFYIGSAALLLFFTLFVCYAVLLHLLGRHKKCRLSAAIALALAPPALVAAIQTYPGEYASLVHPIQAAYFLTMFASALLLSMSWLYRKNNEAYRVLRLDEEWAGEGRLSNGIASTVHGTNKMVMQSKPVYYAPAADTSNRLETPPLPTILPRTVPKPSDTGWSDTTVTKTIDSGKVGRSAALEGTSLEVVPSWVWGSRSSDKQPSKAGNLSTEQSRYVKGPSRMPKVAHIVKDQRYSLEICRRVTRIMKKGFRYRGKLYQYNRFFLKVQDIDLIWRIYEKGRVPKITSRQLRRLKKLDLIELKPAGRNKEPRPFPTEKCRAVKHAIALAAVEIARRNQRLIPEENTS